VKALFAICHSPILTDFKEELLDHINLTQFMLKIWANDALRREFATTFKPVYGREIGEILPDFIDILLLQETPTLIWIVIPPKPLNWPNITEIPDEPQLKPNEFLTKQDRIAAVKAAISKGEIGLPQLLRAVIQSHITAAAWESDGFMQKLMFDPKSVVKQVIAENHLPLELPDDLQFRSLEEFATRRYMTLPTNPQVQEPIGFERTIKTPYKRGTDPTWWIGSSNTWIYSASRHGITLPYCGALVMTTANGPSDAYETVGSFDANGATLTFGLPR
jgi:hypothetical protein